MFSCLVFSVTSQFIGYAAHHSCFSFPPSVSQTTLIVSPFPQALQEKVESLQRQLRCSEKKLLSKELETEEKVIQALIFSNSTHLLLAITVASWYLLPTAFPSRFFSFLLINQMSLYYVHLLSLTPQPSVAILTRPCRGPQKTKIMDSFLHSPHRSAISHSPVQSKRYAPSHISKIP